VLIPHAIEEIQKSELSIGSLYALTKNLIVKLGVFHVIARYNTLESSLKLDQELLCMRPTMSSVSGSEMSLNFIPVFAINAESLKEFGMFFIRPSAKKHVVVL
jgi:hypothetical protein